MGTELPRKQSEERAKRKPLIPIPAPVHSFLVGWAGLTFWLLLLLLLALYPYTGVTSVALFVGSQIFVLVTLASNWNLIGGMTGYVDFGHAVFFGIGAYIMGILVTGSPLLISPQWGFWQALPASGVAAALFALLIGLPTLRLKGPYFSIAMLGTLVAMREIARVLRPITGGGVGLNLPPLLNRLGDYYLMLAVMGLVVSMIWWIQRSEFGLSLIAIREDEIGAEMRGINTGHAVFFGIGAYIMGILVTGSPLLISPEWGFWQALPASGVAAALFALLIGLPTLRLKGPYFSIAMLGTLVAIREITRVLRPITGGGVGLTLPPLLNRLGDYYLMLAVMGLVVSMIWWIQRSEFGLSLIAIREDEIGAEMRGINTTLHKIAAFMIAAFFTGIVGGFWAWQNTYIDPDAVFDEARTVEMVMMSMLGGLGTVWGPPLGAVVIYFLQDLLWGNLFGRHLLALGVLLVVLVLFLPEGILGTLGDRSSTSLGRLLGRVGRSK